MRGPAQPLLSEVPKPLSLGAIKLPGDEQHDVLVMQRAPGTSVQDRPLASLRGDAPRLAAEGIVPAGRAEGCA